MSETKFTPGPWLFEECKGHPDQHRIGLSLCQVTGVSGCSPTGNSYLSISGLCTKQDACLIAAAPDLYEALKAIMDDVEPTEFALSSHIRDAARSALAKARGETP